MDGIALNGRLRPRYTATGATLHKTHNVMLSVVYVHRERHR